MVVDRTGGSPPGGGFDAAGDPDPADPLGAVAAALSRAGHAPLVGDFARAVLRRLPPGHLARIDAPRLAAAVAEVFAFVDARGPEAVALRVSEPDVVIDGIEPRGTVLEVGCEDRPFIVSTVKEELHRLGHIVVRDMHPVYGCVRGPDGRLGAVVAARPAPRRESFLQVELATRIDDTAARATLAALAAVLDDVFAATGDYPAMRAEVERVAARAREVAASGLSGGDLQESAALLEWLLDGNFVLTGSCTYGASGAVSSTALGVMARPGLVRRLPPPSEAQVGDEPVSIVRTAEVSTVHRQVPMHRIDHVEVATDGRPTGVLRLVGVFTAKAQAEPSLITPVLRAKLRRVLELEDVVERSQDEVALVSVLQALPKDQLFEADVEAVRRLASELLAARHERDVRVILRADPGVGTVTALVSVPSEVYSSTLRHRLEGLMRARLAATGVYADVSLGNRPDAIMRLVADVGPDRPELALAGLEDELRRLCRTWDQQLAEALAVRVGPEAAPRLMAAWSQWFPAPYRQTVAAEHAVEDVVELDALCRGAGDAQRVRVLLTAQPGARPPTRLKVYSTGADVELSALLPVLQSLGLWVVDDRPHALGRDDGSAHVHDLGVTDESGAPLDPAGAGARLARAALALWGGRAEVDYLNRLVLKAGLEWDDVAVLRAYRRYRSLVGSAFTADYVDRVLVEHAAVAAGLVELFCAMFDPGRPPEEAERARDRVVAGCEAVARLDHDRILRGMLALVDATLRTNRFLAGADRAGREHLAVKLDPRLVPSMPRPVPFREIFVHGPAVEGVHLRWGQVARGGIRWSDRADDYRSEVLDLMRTQVLKNAVIVPTGAKGGFVVKRPAAGPDRAGPGAVSGPEAYDLFIGCLLDVTDNVVGDEVAAVPRRRDGDDPYLVVAADRGTATFSDRANRLSVSRGFWLGDAFASGGSRGYDHKALGITARGAWVAVRHHFAELGIDIQREPVTVAGIGDMSGDVFGNAMLLSDRIQLVAAFDHRHIFVDPDPDPAASHRERARLAALAGSSWQDYDRALLSAGGGVWSRHDKRIALGPQAREVLRVDAAELTATELVQAVLRAPVGLLFTGGVGTFVRASTEPDPDLDDRANADVRVEGTTIRARVVGEGANLAFTQRARVEYARRGGHINTDAIDNAAGVDISDHEVNLKILLRSAVQAGEVTPAEVGTVLVDACPEVVAAVLRDCDLQSVALLRAGDASPVRMAALEALMAELEAGGVVDRAVEALPGTDEMRARAEAGAGLTRPELAVVLAGAKRSLSARLLASSVPDQPAVRPTLAGYFPASVSERFDHLLDRHRLRRELVSSVLANEVVNRMGATFATRLAADTGADQATVVASYWIARQVLGAPGWWADLDGDGAGGDRPAPEAVLVAAPVLSRLLEGLSRRYLRAGDTADVAAAVARDAAGMAELARGIESVGTDHRQRLRARRREALAERGLAAAVASRWAAAPELVIGPDVVDLARATGRPVTGVAGAALGLGEALGIDRLTERLHQPAHRDRWARAAWRGLLDDLDDLRQDAARRALAQSGSTEQEAVDRFLAARTRAVGAIARLIREIEGDPQAPLDAVAVAARAVRRAIS